jgi:hypothetical protein
VLRGIDQNPGTVDRWQVSGRHQRDFSSPNTRKPGWLSPNWHPESGEQLLLGHVVFTLCQDPSPAQVVPVWPVVFER